MRPLRLALPAGAALVLALTLASPAHAVTVVGLWHMDDTGRVMDDASSYNLDGSVSTNVVTGQTGAVGTAFSFPRKPSVVTVPSSTRLNPGTAVFTVSVRVQLTTKPSSSVGDYDLARKGLSYTSGGHWKMEILQNGYAACVFQGSGGYVSISRGPDLSNGAWHTVSCSREASGVRLTVDGASTFKSGTTGTIANTATMYVGAKNPVGDDQFSGKLDELTITAG